MAPPFYSNDDHPPSSSAYGHSSIYTFPPPEPSSATNHPPNSTHGGARNGAAKTTAPPTSTTTTAAATSTRAPSSRPTRDRAGAPRATTTPRYARSPVPAAAASLLLRRRLLLPALAVPASILAVPPSVASVLSLLATAASGGGRGSLATALATSAAIALSAFVLSAFGRGAIARHAPDEAARRRALAKSACALPFWSLVASVAAARATLRCLGALAPSFSNGGDDAGVSRGWTDWVWDLVAATAYWAVKVAGACAGPALGWAVVSAMVLCRYAGPFCPIVRCSAIPLRTNPFDAALARLGKNLTSKDRFLDMIADGLDRLSAPSRSPPPPVAAERIFVDRTRPTAFAAANQPFANRTFANTTKPRALTTVAPAATAHALTNAALRPSNNEAVNDGTFGRSRKSPISSAGARYSRPGVLPILVQVLVHAVGGHVFHLAFVRPRLGGFLGSEADDAAAVVVALSCVLVPVFDLLSGVGQAELDYGRYSSLGSRGEAGGGGRGLRLVPLLVALAGEAALRARRSIVGTTSLAPVLAAATVLLWSHLGPSAGGGSSMLSVPSRPAVLESLAVSYLIAALLVLVAGVQDVLARWAACAPGTDADVLLFRTPEANAPEGGDGAPSTNGRFLAEDLFVQSILMGDGATADGVIAPPASRSNRAFANHQDEEIGRNEAASASFSEWIRNSSTCSPGGLSDDVLRMSLLESLGGGGSAGRTTTLSHPFHVGRARHYAAVRKRLDLSAAASSPGRQPVAAPVVRALCAFAGGEGDAMVEQYYQPRDEDGSPPRECDDSAELWKLPPGSLDAMEFAIVAAARLVAMNSVTVDERGRVTANASKRHDRLSLLLPCVLQSAYKLRCGIREYARAAAKMNGVDLSTLDERGRDDGLGRFIATNHTNLRTVISACDDSARMVMRVLVETGDSSLEDVLLRRKWKGDMEKWLVGLNCEDAAVARITN